MCTIKDFRKNYGNIQLIELDEKYQKIFKRKNRFVYSLDYLEEIDKKYNINKSTEFIILVNRESDFLVILKRIPVVNLFRKISVEKVVKYHELYHVIRCYLDSNS